PVSWSDPRDAERTWFRDDMHFPEPLTPLTAWLLGSTFNAGTPRACEELAMEMQGLLYGVFNGYGYNHTVPVPEAELPARRERNRQVMPARMDTLRRDWEERYLPRVLELTGEAAAALERLREILVELWHIHFLVVFPKLGCGERFFELYARATGSTDQTEAYRCLQGLPNKSVEAGRALWELAQRAAALPEVRGTIEQEDEDAALAQLDGSEAGRAFRAALDRYLDEYGRRANGIELAVPLWLETPGFVLGLVRSYLVGSSGDPDSEHAALVEERERLIAAALERVAGSELEAPFRHALEVAQAAWPLEEDHAFYIDQRALAAVRLQLLGLGRRLAASGQLAAAADVWFAEPDELRAALEHGADLTRVALERKAERERQRELQPPPFLGAPPRGAADPGLEKFFGQGGPPELADGVLRGAPASAGRVTGVARVITRI